MVGSQATETVEALRWLIDNADPVELANEKEDEPKRRIFKDLIEAVRDRRLPWRSQKDTLSDPKEIFIKTPDGTIIDQHSLDGVIQLLIDLADEADFYDITTDFPQTIIDSIKATSEQINKLWRHLEEEKKDS